MFSFGILRWRYILSLSKFWGAVNRSRKFEGNLCPRGDRHHCLSSLMFVVRHFLSFLTHCWRLFCHLWTCFIFCRCDNCKLCYHFHCLDPPVKVSSLFSLQWFVLFLSHWFETNMWKLWFQMFLQFTLIETLRSFLFAYFPLISSHSLIIHKV